MKILIVIITAMSVMSLFAFVSAFSACSSQSHTHTTAIPNSSEKQDSFHIRIMSEQMLDEVSVGDLINKPDEIQLFVYSEENTAPSTYR